MASKGSRGSGKRDSDDTSPAARRKQVIVGLIIGAVVGVVVGYFTQFWLWVPAGLALGLASGVMIKPPAE
ncbi:HPP family protein [Leucobacter sp. Z1108]|uniref:HPP family protein n=1 Tax=Leucobacter sp. Z1108 TaxID=3439066 RepID=UPI003F347AE4